MKTKTITFRMQEKRLKSLDAVASFEQRDRSFILNQAVDQFLNREQRLRELIEEGLRDDEAGQHVSHQQVVEDLASKADKYRVRKRAS